MGKTHKISRLNQENQETNAICKPGVSESSVVVTTAQRQMKKEQKQITSGYLKDVLVLL